MRRGERGKSRDAKEGRGKVKGEGDSGMDKKKGKTVYIKKIERLEENLKKGMKEKRKKERKREINLKEKECRLKKGNIEKK